MIIIANIFVGLLFIGIGYFVQSDPTVLFGYNRMSEEEKNNLDIQKIAKHAKKTFVTLGSLLILGFFIMLLLDKEEYSVIWMLLVIFVGFGYLLKNSKKFLHNTKKKHTLLGYVILSVAFLFCFIIIFTGMSSMEIKKEGNSVRITNSLGKEMLFSEVQEIKLVSELPKVVVRKGGFELGEVKKGRFKTKDREEIILYLQSKDFPYIMLIKKNGEKMFYNDKYPEKTRQTYQQIMK